MKHEIPAHAVSIWIEGDNIKLGFLDQGMVHVTTLDSGRTGCPSEADAYALAHQMKLDDRAPSAKPMALVRGWAALKRLLRDRAAAVAESKIGTAAALTQFQLDELVKSFGGTVKVVGKKRETENVSLEDLGL